MEMVQIRVSAMLFGHDGKAVLLIRKVNWKHLVLERR